MPSGPEIARHLDLTDKSVPTCPLSVQVPWPIDDRLQQMVSAVAADKLGPTSKKELIAALVQTAEPSPVWLFDKVMTYRHAKVGDATFWLPSDEDPIILQERKPGRQPA